MERIRLSALKIGDTFPKSLFIASGQKLLGAGVVMTERSLAAIRRCGEVEFFLVDSADELAHEGILTRLDTGKLQVGQRPQNSVVTRSGSVVLEPNQVVESHHLDAIAAGEGAFAAKVDPQQRRERILLGDALVEEMETHLSQIELRVAPEPQNVWMNPQDLQSWPTPVKLTELRNAEVDKLRQLYARIEAGVTVPQEQFNPIIDGLIDRLTHHPTCFTQLALLCPRREDYLPDHAYTVTVLALAMAANLHWSMADLRQLALSGLVYDLGMLLVPERIRTGASELSDIDRSRVRRHPVFSLSMLQTVPGISLLVQLAALQHHERENGSGYPKSTRKDAICDYARVISVADAFAATTEPRHYRHPKLPYIAMEETLRSTSAMYYWKPAVRALIQAAGLFPVGSFIKLSTGKNAHVIASNPKHLDRPMVQVLDLEGNASGEPIDLSQPQAASITVVRPIATSKG